jgi:hypothetical protein
MSLSDAENTFKGALIAAADDALGPFVQQVQAEQQAALTQAQADVAALTTEVDALTAQGEKDRQALAANDETIKALEQRHASDAATITQQAARIKQLEAQVPDLEPVPMLVGVTNDAGQSLGSWDVIHEYGPDHLPGIHTPAVVITFTDFLRGKAGTLKGWSKKPTVVAALKTALQAFPDIEGQIVGGTHEPENPNKYNLDAAAFDADENVFSDTVAEVNAGRTHPLKVVRILMAYSLSPRGIKAGRDAKAYLAGRFDYVGMDVYDPDQADLAIACAADLGKPLWICEQGPGDSVDQNDDALLAYAQETFGKYRAAGVLGVTWYGRPGSGADPRKYPKLLAWLLAQTAA